MGLDVKQKVLIAIYTEYQKDIPKMEEAITAKNIGVTRDEFMIALDKLDNEGLVNNIKFARGGDNSIPLHAVVDYAKMSRLGIEYVETKFDIKPEMNGHEKVQSVMAKGVEWGWEQIKDIGSKVLADIAKSQMGV